MNWILKHKQKKSKAHLIALFLVFVLFLNACFPLSARALTAAELQAQATAGNNVFGNTNNAGNINPASSTFGAGNPANTNATNTPTTAGLKTYQTDGYYDPATGKKVLAPPTVSDACPLFDLKCNFTMLLVGVFNFTAFLFAIAATLFSWVVSPANISDPGTGMLQKQAVKDVWIMVRDVLNMTFILVLLFAAFCTIFQVEKWNLKKVWLNILINALLVNFSYPIARFFIDVSNVAFYYFINNLFTSEGAVSGSSILASFGAVSKLGDIIKPGNYSQFPIAYILSMITVTFILGMTLFIIAALFVVRLVALTMLVMFSPVGFVGYIFPATSKYADQWWTQLFSYSFFAPIMIFIMAISLRVMEAMGRENFQSFISNSSGNSPDGQANWIANAAFFVIPIIILWMGIGVAKSFGIAGADSVVGAVKKGGKWLANAPGHYSGVYGATKKATEDFNKKGKLFGMKIPLMGTETREAREARWSAGLTGGMSGYNDAKRDQLRKVASEMRENWKKAGGASGSELERALSGSQAEKMAAALEMSEKNGFKLNDNDSPAQVLARYQSAAKSLTGDKVLQNNFNDKVKEKHIRLVIKDEIATTGDPADKVYAKHLDKMTPNKLAGQKDIFEDVEAKDYMKNRSVTDHKFVRKVAEQISLKDREALKSHGVRI